MACYPKIYMTIDVGGCLHWRRKILRLYRWYELIINVLFSLNSRYINNIYCYFL